MSRDLDQSGTSIQILTEPNDGHVTRFFIKITMSQGNQADLNVKAGSFLL